MHDRDTQHRVFVLGLGGLYPVPEVIRAILAPQDGLTKKIIDLGEVFIIRPSFSDQSLGCGTGIW